MLVGISFITPDKDLVSLAELVNDPFFNDIGKWYDELVPQPGRFKVAVVAYHSDLEAYHYAPALSATDDRGSGEFPDDFTVVVFDDAG